MIRPISLAVVLAWAVLVPAAVAQTICLPRAEVLKNLAENYGERPAGAGLAGDGNVIELLAAPDGTTWTMIYTRPNGLSCLIVAGDAWATMKAPVVPPSREQERGG